MAVGEAENPDTGKPSDGPVASTEELLEVTKPTMAVKIYAPFKVYFEGRAESVSALNKTGPFDILPGHRNFLCMLMPCDITVITDSGSKKTVKVSRALMHVKADRVVVFVDV